MEQSRREEFILDARRAARTSQKPNGHADSDAVDSDAIAKILKRAGLWLTSKVVNHYHPDDFLGWHKEQQDRLRSAVEAFREIANQTRPDQPLTIEQFMEGAQRFRELINSLGGWSGTNGCKPSTVSKNTWKNGLRKRNGARGVSTKRSANP